MDLMGHRLECLRLAVDSRLGANAKAMAESAATFVAFVEDGSGTVLSRKGTLTEIQDILVWMTATEVTLALSLLRQIRDESLPDPKPS